MNIIDVGIGICIGLGLAACGWTAGRISTWLKAKVAVLEAQALHIQAVTAAVASSPMVAAAAAAASSAVTTAASAPATSKA